MLIPDVESWCAARPDRDHAALMACYSPRVSVCSFARQLWAVGSRRMAAGAWAYNWPACGPMSDWWFKNIGLRESDRLNPGGPAVWR